jgi:phosphate-selective porin
MFRKSSKIKLVGIALASLGAAAMSSSAFADKSQTKIDFGAQSAEGVLAQTQDGLHSLQFDGFGQIDWTHFDVNTALKEGRSSGADVNSNGLPGGNADAVALSNADALNTRVYGSGFSTGMKLRNFVLNARGAFGCDFQFRVGLGFKPDHDRTTGYNTGDGQLKVRLLPTFLNYSGLSDMGYGNINLMVGQVSPFIGFDNSNSIKETLFLERALASAAFDAPYVLGGMAHGYWDMFTANLAAFTNTGDSDEPGVVWENTNVDRTKKNDVWGFSGRATISPVHDADTTYHAGAHFWHQGLLQRGRENANEGLLFHTGINPDPEACSRNSSSLISTGYFTAKSFTQWGLEAAAAWGPWNVRGEFLQRKYKRDNLFIGGVERELSDPSFYGWHAEASWIITGERRPYDAKYGVFSNPTPDCCCGAWEVAARYSYLSLQDTDKGFDGTEDTSGNAANPSFVNRGIKTGTTGSDLGRFKHGVEHNYTFGVNWFPSHHVKVSANWVHAKAKYAGSNHRGDEKLDAFAVRAQFAW